MSRKKSDSSSSKDDFMNALASSSDDEVVKTKVENSEEISLSSFGKKLAKKYEGEKKKKAQQTISIRISFDLYERLSGVAKNLDVSVATLSRDLIEESVEKL